MRMGHRLKKLEERLNVYFVVAVPEIEYFGDDCTGAIVRLRDEVVYQAHRELYEDTGAFKTRFAREYKEACREKLSKEAKTVVVLGDEVRRL